MTEDVADFIDRAAKDCAGHLMTAAILAKYCRIEKEKKPKKKCRQPPKYV